MILDVFSASVRLRRLLGLIAAVGGGALLASPGHAANQFAFPMVRTQGLPAGCATNVAAWVQVDTTPGFTERLVITVTGFTPNTPLVLFTIQKPNAPFGIGWYQGDVAIGPQGWAQETFVSRFNIETFALAVDTPAVAPLTHPVDATSNPVFNPVHTYHLGIWFDSVEAAVANGCPPNQTFFNGDHTAGPQVMNTGTFADEQGPLSNID
jgi:hypothetical protein